MKEGDQQFGSWLPASTPNIAKKTLVRVAGYEKEVIKETEMNSSGGGGGGDDGVERIGLSTKLVSEGREEQRVPTINAP